MTYFWLSLIFLTAAALVLAGALLLSLHRRTLLTRWIMPIVAAGVVLMILTAVFDNVMILVGLITYDQTTISGLFVGLAPLEDFAYPLAGLILLPSVWLLLGKRGNDGR